MELSNVCALEGLHSIILPMGPCNAIIHSLILLLQTSKSLSDTAPHIPPASCMEFMASRDASNGLKFITFRAKKIFQWFL